MSIDSLTLVERHEIIRQNAERYRNFTVDKPKLDIQIGDVIQYIPSEDTKLRYKINIPQYGKVISIFSDSVETTWYNPTINWGIFWSLKYIFKLMKKNRIKIYKEVSIGDLNV